MGAGSDTSRPAWEHSLVSEPSFPRLTHLRPLWQV